MFPTALLTVLLPLVVCIAANPIVVRRAPVSLPISRRLNITGAHDLVYKDQARAIEEICSLSKKSSGVLPPATS
jgi:cathepsin E